MPQHQWDNKQQQDRMLTNFQTYFRDAQKALRCARVLTFGISLKRERVMNLVSEEVFKALQDFQSSETKCELSPEITSDIEAIPSLVATD